MASLSAGSVNFTTTVYENTTSLVTELAATIRQNAVLPEIEIFDLLHLNGARRLLEAGLIDDAPHVQFVMGVNDAMAAEQRLLNILLAGLRRILPRATWTAAGIGRHQTDVMRWALTRDANAIRIGLEDNIRVARDRLATSNAELVTIAAGILSEHGRRPATPTEARAILGFGAGGPTGFGRH